jgi:hypothetical protein
MSRTTSNTSVLSDGRYVPWQFKWKRPMISQTKSVHEKYSFGNDVRNRVPISIASTRLNSAEVGLILRHMGCFTEKDEEQVHLDESTSSYDRQGKKPSMAPKDDASYFVLATTFAPKSIVRFLQTNAKEDDDFKVIPADAILLEVVQDSFRTFDSGTAEDEWGRDDMNIILSRLLYWPSSIHEYSVFEDDDQNKNDAGNIWMSMLRALALRKSNTEMTDEEKQQQKLLKLKKIKRRIGITALSISRKTDKSSEQEVDMDEVFGLVDRLGLNVDINLDPNLLKSSIVRKVGSMFDPHRVGLSCYFCDYVVFYRVLFDYSLESAECNDCVHITYRTVLLLLYVIFLSWPVLTHTSLLL